MRVLIVSLCLFVTAQAEGIVKFFSLDDFPRLEYQQSEEEATEDKKTEAEAELMGETDDLKEEGVDFVDPLWQQPDELLGQGVSDDWDKLIALERHVQDYRTTVIASVTASNLYSAYSTGVVYEEFTSSKFNWGLSIEREQFYWKNKTNPRYPKGQEEIYYNQVWMNYFPVENLQLYLFLGAYVRD